MIPGRVPVENGHTSRMTAAEIVDLGAEVLNRWYPRPVFVVHTDLVRATNPHLTRPERVPVHLVLVTERGVGLHTVDSATLRTEPGVVVHVRPGQVQQWAPAHHQPPYAAGAPEALRSGAPLMAPTLAPSRRTGMRRRVSRRAGPWAGPHAALS